METHHQDCSINANASNNVASTSKSSLIPFMTDIMMIKILIRDVRASQEAFKLNDTAYSRRILIRTIFAAIDGLVHSYRNFVRAALRDAGLIRIDEELALSELSTTVTKAGKVTTHSKFIPTSHALRLASRMAKRANPDAALDFSGTGWRHFNDATEVRNRLTHPKSASDLEVSDETLKRCENGLYWLLETVVEGMDASLIPARERRTLFRDFLTQLHAGDPEAWEEYEAARAKINQKN